MPIIKPQHIVSFSNAETNHPAENLLKPEGTFKWKVPGGKAATAVLQFEKATEIHSIDIGNEGSAFVEVLAGKSTSNSDQSYEVLLVASSFMTPVESRNGTNRNSVRMFGPDKLNKTVATQKWDRVKIVCTQPFNKTASYGLSFITFHSPPEAQEQKEKESGSKKIGAFTLKPESGDPISTGSVFEKKKTQLTGAAAVRAASKLAEESRGTPAKSEESKPVQKAATPSEKPSTSVGGSKRKHTLSDDEDEDKAPPTKPPMKKQSTSISSTASSLKGSERPPLKKTKSDTSGQAKPFHKLMKGVVFVLSGYQNPFRAELRDMATEMGAEYKPDWKKGCTHLICAFQNTPKYNQVKGKGKIVKKEWIQHMYKQKKPLPWRKYRLGDADTPEGTSEEESDDDDTPAVKEPVQKAKPKESKASPEKHASKGKTKKGVDFDGDTDSGGEEAPMDYGGDTDSGGDTEDELEKVKAKLASESKKSNPYGDSTDEDEPSKKSPKPSPSKNNSNPQPSTSHQSETSKAADDSDDSGLPDLPDYFTDKHFFLYGDFPSGERRLLTRYITAYNGEIEEYMNDKVHYVITNSDWDKNFDDALSDNPKLVFVKPKWIHMCHEKEKLVPYQHYIVIPKDD
ncbi:DNA repair protein XRCC1-like isoform X2 [Saccostrea echinata]|uniref:DNA repair protein XRCC1-like isoform X2 n=1 Tax=Saccostrea echinata TaxID=191078 RepID=UPI002A83146E|nr:DNA repair protein XRCC1-like isoform X2 [Saccostrea echinata]